MTAEDILDDVYTGLGDIKSTGLQRVRLNYLMELLNAARIMLDEANEDSPAPPLSGYSMEDLIREIQRRGSWQAPTG